MTDNDLPDIGPSFEDTFTYTSYLRIPELLDLQQGVSADPETGESEHDETMFIIIHQIYELWFKQILHEIDHIVVSLDANRISAARHHLWRVLRIMKTLIGQIDVLETMTPLEFASFRSFLANASGFQSAQFRELEFALGIKDRVQLDWFQGDEADRLATRYDAPTLWDAFVRYLHNNVCEMPAAVLERDVREPIEPNADLQAVFVERYSDEAFAAMCEMLTDLDSRLQEWRYRHVVMVRRTIGTKPGTGGSDGASYLATTLLKPAFPDLWAIRTAF